MPILNQIIKETVDIYNEKRPHISNHMITTNQVHEQKKGKPLKLKQHQNKYDAVLVINLV